MAGGTDSTVKAVTAEEKSLLMKKSDGVEPERRVFVNEDIKAPVKQGDVIGELQFVNGEDIIDKVELKAANDVNKKGIAGIMRGIVLGFLI